MINNEIAKPNKFIFSPRRPFCETSQDIARESFLSQINRSHNQKIINYMRYETLLGWLEV